MSAFKMSDLRNKVEQKMGNLDQKMGNVTLVDPSRFNDPIALQTQWTSVHPGAGGTNFSARKLVQADPNTIRFKPTGGLIAFLIFYNLIVFAGLVLIFTTAHLPLPPQIFVCVMQIVGLLAIITTAQPIVFSRTDDMFYKGWKKPEDRCVGQESKNRCSLNDVYALQLLSRRVVTQDDNRRRTYMTYELNLILKDGRRLFTVDSGKQSQITEDARKLADFLGKPLWDAA
jgi:hypothetical protein